MRSVQYASMLHVHEKEVETSSPLGCSGSSIKPLPKLRDVHFQLLF